MINMHRFVLTLIQEVLFMRKKKGFILILVVLAAAGALFAGYRAAK